MKPAPFEFHAPHEEAEILGLLAEHGEDARPLAGGQSLVPLMNMRVLQPKVVVSLNRCESLAGLDEEGNYIACGALARQAAAERSPAVRERVPLLAEALPYVGVQANRNFGTVCGSLAHADPLAELPSVAAALEARFVIAASGRTREVGAEEFFVAPLTTCLEPGELLREVRFPATRAGSRSVFLEVANRAHGFAVAGLAAYVELGEERRVGLARLAAMGMENTTVRLRSAERILQSETLTEPAIRAAGAAATALVEPSGDIHASARYRRHLIGVLVERALRSIAAGGGEARSERAGRH